MANDQILEYESRGNGNGLGYNIRLLTDLKRQKDKEVQQDEIQQA